jgi:hypothetical protein
MGLMIPFQSTGQLQTMDKGQGKLFQALILLVFLGGLLHTALPMLRTYTGVVWGDAYTYVTTARHLARGHIYLDGPLADLLAAQERPDQNVWEPIWNHSIRPNGKTVSTHVVGLSSFFIGRITDGWDLAFCACEPVSSLDLHGLTALVIWEGLDRSRSGAMIGALVGLLMPWTQLSTFAQFAYLWREPLFYNCLMIGCYAFLRFLHTRHLRWLPILGFVLGYACAIKEANAIYLAAFGTLSCWRDRGPTGGASFP